MTSDNQTEQLNKLVHDARGPLNRISMNAELIKLVLENDMPKEKALDALPQIYLYSPIPPYALRRL